MTRLFGSVVGPQKMCVVTDHILSGRGMFEFIVSVKCRGLIVVRLYGGGRGERGYRGRAPPRTPGRGEQLICPGRTGLAVWWMHHISVCDFLHGKMRAKSNCSHIPWGGPSWGCSYRCARASPSPSSPRWQSTTFRRLLCHVSVFLGHAA